MVTCGKLLGWKRGLYTSSQRYLPTPIYNWHRQPVGKQHIQLDVRCSIHTLLHLSQHTVFFVANGQQNWTWNQRSPLAFPVSKIRAPNHILWAETSTLPHCLQARGCPTAFYTNPSSALRSFAQAESALTWHLSAKPLGWMLTQTFHQCFAESPIHTRRSYICVEQPTKEGCSRWSRYISQ